jgi:photosynthetic reaction center cytochrome c subunit
MVAMTAWVAPEKAATTATPGANLADDSKYTKVVARRMIEMTRHINADWSAHVAKTGVTCYTCHRGRTCRRRPGRPPRRRKRSGPGSLLGNDFGQNKGVPSIAWRRCTTTRSPAVLDGKEADPRRRPAGPAQRLQGQPDQSTEKTYSLMNHISLALGVNCTFCHNTRSFQSWEGPTQRVTAWHGIQMARDLNVDYMKPLTGTFPASRLGPTGDVAKVFCATCHQGQNKPLGGVAMAKTTRR